MARSVYVASAEGWSGKSTIALGLVEQLSRRVGRVGVFRPVVRSGGRRGEERDYVLEMLLAHPAVALGYDDCAGVTYAQVHADPAAALDRVVEQHRRVAERSDAVVVVGSDYTDVSDPMEFSSNARTAANLGAPVVLVLNGHGRRADDLRVMAEIASAELDAQHGTLLAVVANRVSDPQALAEVAALTVGDALAFGLPEVPLLAAPTLADVMAAVAGTLVHGDAAQLGRECLTTMVAAMTLPHVLERMPEQAVVVIPGDRPETLLGVVTAHLSASFPQVCGVVLSGGLDLPVAVLRLLDGLGVTLPVIATDLDTHEASTVIGGVRGRLTAASPRKMDVAAATFAQHVDAAVLLDRLEVARSSVVTPLMFEQGLLDRAAADRRHVVLPEGDDERILSAADALLRRGTADLTLLGDPVRISATAAGLGVDVSAATIINPADPASAGELVERFAAEYHRRRRHKGIDLDEARATVTDVSYFGTMMVELGLADGMVSGAAHTTAHTIRPALEIVKTSPGVLVVSSVFFMCLADRVLVYGDCAVNPEPTAEQLADIAIASAGTAAAFGVEPRVALLSYSTGTSGAGADVDKVARATGLVHERAPQLQVEGPVQYDAAIDPAVAATKLPGSTVAGRATVLVFPDLNAGNNTYKAVQRSAHAVAVGPVLQGLRKPVNDLSRGATVRDIVNTVAITAIQAQQVVA